MLSLRGQSLVDSALHAVKRGTGRGLGRESRDSVSITCCNDEHQQKAADLLHVLLREGIEARPLGGGQGKVVAAASCLPTAAGETA